MRGLQAWYASVAYKLDLQTEQARVVPLLHDRQRAAPCCAAFALPVWWSCAHPPCPAWWWVRLRDVHGYSLCSCRVCNLSRPWAVISVESTRWAPYTVRNTSAESTRWAPYAVFRIQPSPHAGRRRLCGISRWGPEDGHAANNNSAESMQWAP